MNSPYARRWKALADALPDSLLATKLVPRSVAEGIFFFRKAIEEGHEGLMAKAISATYTEVSTTKKRVSPSTTTSPLKESPNESS